MLKETFATVSKLEDERAELMEISTQEHASNVEYDKLIRATRQDHLKHSTNEQECAQLRDQLSGSQMELSKAQVQIAELQQQLSQAESESAAASAAATRSSRPLATATPEKVVVKAAVADSPNPSYVQSSLGTNLSASYGSAPGYTLPTKATPKLSATASRPYETTPHPMTTAVPGGSINMPVAKLNGSISLPGAQQGSTAPQPIRMSYGTSRSQYNAPPSYISPIRGQTTYTRTAAPAPRTAASAPIAYGGSFLPAQQQAPVVAPIPYGAVRQVMSTDNAGTVASGRLRLASSPISTSTSRNVLF